MPANEPSWWYSRDPSIARAILKPVAALWSQAAKRRLTSTAPYTSSLPVVCIGNFTAGGTGKTPLSICIARMLFEAGMRPAFLTRGYGGRLRGPHKIALDFDTADVVGDEALLLARHAPTMLARDRALGDDASDDTPAAGVIIMDDGLQNPLLAKDVAIAVVDATRGFGNGEVIPAGPLRAPLSFQLGLVDAIVINRQTKERDVPQDLRRYLEGLPNNRILEAWVEPCVDREGIAGKTLVGLCAIANPQRFFDLVQRLGGEVAERIVFPDHHQFTDAEARNVLNRAAALGAQIVTTEKDYVRLFAKTGAVAELRAAITPIPIELVMSSEDAQTLSELLATAIERKRIT